ncbi:MAG: hypothetical protein AB7R90_03385 [Reyranellaceae bacterium]
MNFQGPLDFETFSRIDFYATPHKGLRRALYGASQAIAAADPSDQAAVDTALDLLHDTLKLVSRLGAVESVRIHAFLEALRPGATQAAQADSERQTLAIGALVQLEKEVRAADRKERRELLATLNSTYAGFVGEVLQHLYDAEMELMPLLRETVSYEELNAIQRQIFADLGRDAFVALVREIVPAVPSPERTEFLSTVQRCAPSAVWPSIWWAVCALLSENEQEDFTRLLGVDCARIGLGQGF